MYIVQWIRGALSTRREKAERGLQKRQHRFVSIGKQSPPAFVAALPSPGVPSPSKPATDAAGGDRPPHKPSGEGLETVPARLQSLPLGKQEVQNPVQGRPSHEASRSRVPTVGSRPPVTGQTHTRRGHAPVTGRTDIRRARGPSTSGWNSPVLCPHRIE